MVRAGLHLSIVVFLTFATQLGGLAWLAALLARRRFFVFALTYIGLWAGALAVAPATGRTALHCWEDGPLVVRSWIYCATNRTYMSPELLAALRDVADRLEAEHPGTRLQVLDAGFPFLDGFPLLPHLSHDDGDKADLALHYVRMGNAERTPSPIGYFAFEPGPTDCPERLLSLRWDMAWLQPFWPRMALDEVRTARVVTLLTAHPAISKVLLEPHLTRRLGVSDDKVRFQGCRAARHDDHIHVQL